MGRVLDRLADLVPEWSVPDVAVHIVLALVLASGLLVAVRPACRGAGPAAPAAATPRPARTWAPPLVALAVMIGAFLAMQAVTASGHDLIGRRGGPSYADRVHQGFGQLLVVSMIVVGVVAWAAHLCDRDRPGQRRRRLLAVAAGPVVALTLGLAGVALGRLFGYEEAYGFTRMRMLVGGFELWLAAVLVLIAGAWFAPVARRLPVIVIASAGLAVLGIGAVGTDASVGRLNVEPVRAGRASST